MKLTKQLFGFALTAIAAGAFVACTNELTDPSLNKGKDGVLKLVKTPEVYAWSGNQTLNSDINSPGSFNTRAMEGYSFGDNNVSWTVIEESPFYLPCGIINKYLDDKLPEEVQITDPDIDTDFLYYANTDTEIEFYPVYGQSNTPHTVYIFYYDSQGNLHELRDTPIFTTIQNQYYQYEHVGQSEDWNENISGIFVGDDNLTLSGGGYFSASKHKGIKLKIKQGCKFGFIWNGTIKLWNEDKQSGKIYYDIEYSSLYTHNLSTYCTDGTGDRLIDGEHLIQSHAVTFSHNGCTFLGMEDWNDFDYQDMVFMFTSVLTTVDSNTIEDDDFFCDVEDSECGSKNHPKHEGDCPFCDEHTTCNPGCPNTWRPSSNGCSHSASSHNPDGSCNECQDHESCKDTADKDSCPKRINQWNPCPHPRSAHDEEGYCELCTGEGENSWSHHCKRDSSTENPENKENCPHCPHPEHGVADGGYCDQCGENNGCNKKDTVENCPNCPHPEHGVDHGGYCEQCGENNGCNKKDTVENCPVEGCDHPKHDNSNCTQCAPGSTCNPTPGGNTGTTKPGEIYKHDNEVEVNFEIVDSHMDAPNKPKYGIEDLATKLSIHVRHATNVDIMIPLPNQKYVIDSDDLYIFNEHYVGGSSGVYGGAQIEEGTTTLTYQIADRIVTLYVDVVIAGTDEGATTGEPYPFDKAYIHVWTTGIDERVWKYCMDFNGDGINFEIWTYFNLSEELTRGELQRYLDQSTIEFEHDPNYYINAFGYDYVEGTWGQTNKGIVNPDDCYVKPVDKNTYKPRQKPDYKPRNEMTSSDKWDEHLNGTPYNQIWVKDGATPDHAHGGLN